MPYPDPRGSLPFGEPHIGVPTPLFYPHAATGRPLAKAQMLALEREFGLHPGRGLSFVGSAIQPGRMRGSGGGLRSPSKPSACRKPLGAPMWSCGDEEIVIRGENVLPVRTESTNGGDSLTLPVSGTESSEKPGFSPPIRELCSGIGWTNAKHTIAMMVATVAQALTKDRLIPGGALCKCRATRTRETGPFSAMPSCSGARSGEGAREEGARAILDERPSKSIDGTSPYGARCVRPRVPRGRRPPRRHVPDG